MMMPKPTRFTNVVRNMMKSGRDKATPTGYVLRATGYATGLRPTSLPDLHARDYDRLHRHVVHSRRRVGRHRGNPIRNVHAREDPSKNGIPEVLGCIAGVIQPAVVDDVDVELGGAAAKG